MNKLWRKAMMGQNKGPKYSEGLTYSHVTGGYSCTGLGTCTDEDIVIPPEYNGEPVIEIASWDSRSWPTEGSIWNLRVRSLTVPDTVRKMNGIVYFFNLRTITIGTGITNLGSYAFYCSGNGVVRSLTIKAVNPPTLGTAADLRNADIYVPAESVEAYKTAWAQWDVAYGVDITKIQAIPN